MTTARTKARETQFAAENQILRDALRALLFDLKDLMGQSDGVAGLDVDPDVILSWESLEPIWLASHEPAVEALEGVEGRGA